MSCRVRMLLAQRLCVASFLLLASDASTQVAVGQSPIIVSEQGLNGTDGDTAIDNDTDGSPGQAAQDGASILRTNTAAISVSSGSTVSLSTRGGTGGKGGDVFDILGFGTSEGGEGGRGGNGGAIEFYNNAALTIDGGANSHGIDARSLGGKGGNGGLDFGGAVGGDGGSGGLGGAVEIDNAGNITIGGTESRAIWGLSAGGLGGEGGEGHTGGTGGGLGTGGHVRVVNSGNIQTGSAHSIGIEAQSIGGGANAGGDGRIGGGAESAGDGSLTEVTLAGEVKTLGTDSIGILAQSIGGGGGNGGHGSGSHAVGGEAGAGGDGGTVNVMLTETAVVETDEVRSHGLLVQSVGGGGGRGGNADAGGSSSTVAIGGSGGGGGDGGTVMTEIAEGASVSTLGQNSMGLIAQSIGGGGGNGGYAHAEASGFLSASALAVGGSGGAGGDGGLVDLTIDGSIVTEGDDSRGILAQSIGGGGGNGGAAVANASALLSSSSHSVGGSGAVGGHGNTVSVTTHAGGLIHTKGERSIAIQAQGIGGGGGNGGTAMAFSGALGMSDSTAIGGTGGGGGNGDQVTINSHAQLITEKSESTAIQAQSIGGGGGNGGSTLSVAAGGVLAHSVSIGGDSGTGGNGAEVEVTATNTIETMGDRSIGVQAQSIGGGGGNGGASLSAAAGVGLGHSLAVGGMGGPGGSGSTIQVITEASVATSGNLADGIQAQSIGGGGGNGGSSTSFAGGGVVALGISIGGSGGVGGSGDSVNVTQNGSVTTSGVQSNGINAQSIGGGGGNGGQSVAGAVSLDPVAASFAIGGSGGSGNHGDTVTVTSRGELNTSGDNSVGILAQSVGGGGGNGGASVALSGSLTGGAASLSLGGKGGAGGNAAIVAVDADSNLTTLGDHSIGILAHSVGGGGGNGGLSIAGSGGALGAASVAVGGEGDAGGTADLVTVNSAGDLSTSGILAHGIQAQSIGGGGGNGGFAISGSAVVSGVSVSAAVGGDAGDGSTGGEVEVETQGSIVTTGLSAHAINAQSIGGGGGNGGFAGSLTASDEALASVSVAAGGSGGAGGDAGTVSVASAGERLSTAGTGANAIQAQSIGAGGGDGGFALAASLSAEGSAATLDVTLGGTGGAGGAGAVVEIANSSEIDIAGDNSNGILAQSIGGGGGNGGFAASFSGTTGANAVQANVGLGGNGSSGNHASAVAVANSNSITTTGTAHSVGINALSVGGGGGNGGLSFAGAINADNSSAPSTFDMSLGGSGGDGGQAGEVDAAHTAGTISTSGIFSDAILAQSIGGGGGTGGTSVSGLLGYTGAGSSVTTTVNIGGSGGSGQIGNVVAAFNGGDVVTTGIESRGVVARSVGGGGGNGGGAFAGILGVSNADPDLGKTRTVKLTYNVGGGGGSGNHGGYVEAENAGSITTSGGSSYGLQAQSIGGGGGEGGDSHSKAFIIAQSTSDGAMPDAQNSDISFTATIGGSGGDASHGGKVTATNSGTIDTDGGNAVGIFAQSIGGGGGNGGNGVLGTGESHIDDVGTVLTAATRLDRWDRVTVTVGGSGGSQGDGGEVLVNNTGAITTQASDAHGIHAQSIGGGGGVGGTSVVALRGTLGIGGSAGAGGNASEVTIAHSEDAITTFGDSAMGIFAQSIGGGGGVAGSVSRALASEGSVAGSISPVHNIGLNIAFGGNGGDGGNGGNVSLELSSDITANGEAAYGVFAQSIGGGGGIVGTLGNEFLADVQPEDTDILTGHIGSVGDNGDAGTINVTQQSGSIKANGERAHGIFAQSAGGIGHGANVSISIDGEVLTQAEDTYGVLAQSVGSLGAGNIEIEVGESGRIQGGSGAGASVRFEDGVTNQLLNRGLITTTVSADGTAVVGTDGSENIDNYGQIAGSLYLGNGSDNVVVRGSGLLESGTNVDFGDSNEILENQGRLSPGGSGSVAEVEVTEINGTLNQTSTGTYVVDVNLSGNPGTDQLADQLNVTGTATISGTVELSILNDGEVKPGLFETTIVDAAGGIDATAVQLDAPESAVVRYELNSPNSQELSLRYGVDFAPEGLTPNKAVVGEFFNQMQLEGTEEGVDVITAELVNLDSVDDLSDAYGQLTGEVYGSLQQTALLSTNNLFQLLTSQLRPTMGASTGGAFASSEPTGQDIAYATDLVVPVSYQHDTCCNSCSAQRTNPRWRGWVMGYGSGGRMDRVEGSNDIRFSAGGALVGIQHWADRGTLVGGFLASGKHRTSLPEPDQLGEVDATQFGFYIRQGEVGEPYMLLVASAGYDSYSTRRYVSVGGFSESVSADFNGHQHTIYTEGGKEIRWSGIVFAPYASLQYTNVYRETFEESGPTVANLRVQSVDPNFLRGGLGLRVLGDKHWLNPEVRFNWMHEFLDTSSVVTSSFTAAGSAGNFTTFGPQLARDSFLLGTGGRCWLSGSTSIALNYDSQLSDQHAVHSGSATLEVAW